MYKLQDHKIVFPLTIGRTGDYVLSGIREDWRKLEEMISVEYFDNFGVLTGTKNNMTVLQLHHAKLENLGFDNIDTLMVNTPDGYTCYVFDYEQSLNTIYKLTNNLSIYNDNSYIIAGQQYRVIGDSINKMPSQLLDYVLEQQRLNTPAISKELYDLLMLLPDSWFKARNQVERMIYSLRDCTQFDQDIWVPTLKKLLRERWDLYHDQDIIFLLMKKLTSEQRRMTFGGLKKQIRNQNIHGYKQWELRYKEYKYRRIVYKQNANIPLKLAQELLPKDRLTPAKLSKSHKDIQLKSAHACKSCGNIAKSGCCKDYAKSNRSKRVFIINAEII